MTLLKCKECKKKISSEVSECPKCGCPHPFPMTKCKNKKCGETIPKGLSKCPNCGKSENSLIGSIAIFIVIAVIAKYALSSDDGDKSTTTKDTPIVNEYEANQNKTLREIKELSSDKRKEIYQNFYQLNTNTLTKVGQDLATACISDHIFNKDGSLKLSEVAGWCLTDAKNNKSFGSFYNHERFESYFSFWDGSFKPLVSLVENNMNDPDSFEHVSTTYRFERKNDDIVAFIRMNYRGKNAFGGVVTETILVKVNPNTGSILEVIEQG